MPIFYLRNPAYREHFNIYKTLPINRGTWVNMTTVDSMKTFALPPISKRVELYEITFIVLVPHAKDHGFGGMTYVNLIALFSEKNGLKHKCLLNVSFVLASSVYFTHRKGNLCY
jgi:hypothetical protein